MKILTSSVFQNYNPSPIEPPISRKLLNVSGLSFEAFMEMALYDPVEGYYSSASWGADYASAARLSPVFGFALARLVSEFVSRCSDGLTGIVDIGCGDGTLLEAIISELPAPVVERCAFWGIDRVASRRSTDPRIFFTSDLSAIPNGMPVLVLTNELFDALPFARLVKRSDGLRELHVVARGGMLDWDERPAREEHVAYFRARGIELQDGQFADVSLDWSMLYGRICDLPNVRMIVSFDYGYPQQQLFDPRIRRFGTAAAYFRHRVSRDLLARPGEQDLTAHVNFSDPMSAGEARGLVTLAFSRQAEFLLKLGITEHPLFTPAGEVEVDSLGKAVEVNEQREAARRLVLPDGIGQEIRVLVQVRDLPVEGWSFQQKLF